jgi:UDP-glucose 4-epimerase
LEYLLAGKESRPMNLGTGHGYSVAEVVHAVESLTGSRVPISNESRRPGDVPELVADATQARQLLGWKPHRSDLHFTLATAWQWMQAQERAPVLQTIEA